MEKNIYLKGEKLFGDDFSPEKLEEWYEDERDGYCNLCSTERSNYAYGYTALNKEYGFRLLPERIFSNVLGVGSAYGDELLPITGKSINITILEPSDGFVVNELAGIPVMYVKPQASGILPFADLSFDLVTCFGVLHHVPNVSTVLNEFHRCMRPDSYLLVREPIISMGDWRRPRHGLTKRERGIPLQIFRSMILSAGFEIVSEKKCMFSLSSRLKYLIKQPVYCSRLAIIIDKLLCVLPVWSDRYHPNNFLHKLRPSSVFYVLHKI